MDVCNLVLRPLPQEERPGTHFLHIRVISPVFSTYMNRACSLHTNKQESGCLLRLCRAPSLLIVFKAEPLQTVHKGGRWPWVFLRLPMALFGKSICYFSVQWIVHLEKWDCWFCKLNRCWSLFQSSSVFLVGIIFHIRARKCSKLFMKNIMLFIIYIHDNDPRGICICGTITEWTCRALYKK